ncbi:MAG: hypothetical protein OMM_04499 [Candidatus Magnetoglobus multicellularis str. Araruama]|uniref:Transglutaminase-like domain-containing protein n=1 Tax=Candidatus Magnetoglobus multicellularis str. Araruama TaxID=890399 RepID=A0A1V1P171_9BACT|nr:MAG: hypothetical protein OMM_04499 [Candidatus Magnetoglobus multicellularis str. Araruama]
MKIFFVSLLMLLFSIVSINASVNNVFNDLKSDQIEDIRKISRAVLASRNKSSLDIEMSYLKDDIVSLRELLIEAKDFFSFRSSNGKSKKLTNSSKKYISSITILLFNIKQHREKIMDEILKGSNSNKIDTVKQSLKRIQDIELQIDDILKIDNFLDIISLLQTIINSMEIKPAKNEKNLTGESGIWITGRDLSKGVTKTYLKKSNDTKLLKTKVTEAVPLSDYLKESNEVEYSTNDAKLLREKADELSTPVKLYEYILNNYEYIMYYGSRSDSVNTFLSKRGNDIDLATLLIAMLRSQNIPSRYVAGNVQIPVEEVLSWLEIPNVDLAMHLMNERGVQNISLLEQNGIQYMEFEHVWVEIFVSY